MKRGLLALVGVATTLALAASPAAASPAHNGLVSTATSQLDQARAAWTTALTILTSLDHPDADPLRAKIHDVDQARPGHHEDHAATGDPDRAEDTR